MKGIFELFYRLCGVIGTLMTAYFSYSKSLNIFIKSLLVITLLICAAMLIIDVIKTFKSRPFCVNKRKSNANDKISEYIIKEIKSSNRIAIFSKDLTWVKRDSHAYSVLKNKAIEKELILFIKDETEITNNLAHHGAKVYSYSETTHGAFSPKSRFTILDYGNTGERVMIGAPRDGYHYINHFNSKDFEVTQLASDFVDLLRKTTEVRK